MLKQLDIVNLYLCSSKSCENNRGKISKGVWVDGWGKLLSVKKDKLALNSDPNKVKG